ncbi:hypothetical protein EZS27_009217 [termite gut metagenome]|uniref:Uncharacterized protein n=1 Tax=termite gut metagenome TaxID=433724 RepID=A0A5J4SA72_9ZZZZ
MKNFDEYSEKRDIALEQKSNITYKARIFAELSKPDWQNQKTELDAILKKLKSQHGFEEYQKKLQDTFNALYEIITAPGVDDVIGWIDDITSQKKNLDTKKLRKFLVDNISEHSDAIEKIVNHKDVLQLENSIFSLLLEVIRKEFKKRCNSFLDKPSEFENEIDEFLDNISDDLEQISGIDELSYTSIDQFYTVEHKAADIQFYQEIIDKGIKMCQKLSEKDNIAQNVESIISEIKEMIHILADSSIAISDDDIQKELFLRFDKEINFGKGLSEAINKFIDGAWTEIRDRYVSIKDFFEDKHAIEYKSKWDSFPQNDAITINSLISSYNSLLKDDPLVALLSKPTDEISSILKKKASSIEKFKEQSSQLKKDISDVFNMRLEEYDGKKDMVENLSSGDKNLEEYSKNIKKSIEGLIYGIKNLDSTDDLMIYLKDDFDSHFNTYNDIHSNYKHFLQSSGMEKQLQWLDLKVGKNGSTATLDASDLNEVSIIQDLLKFGLIKLELQKTF